MNLKYFVSIDSGNLGLYFSRAIISPHKYLKETINDFQGLVPTSLIISNKPFTTLSDCALEIILTDNEITKLYPSKNEDISFLDIPIPITRVSKILFYSEEKMKRTLSLAESSSFIPESLIQLVEKKDYIFLQLENFHSNNYAHSVKSYTDEIELYNRYLGGFAFMMLGGEPFMNYSSNYFPTLGFFNTLIQKEVLNVEKKHEIKFEHSYIGLFKNDGQWENFLHFIFGDDTIISTYLKAENIPYSNNLFRKESIETNRKNYILSILANYGHYANKSLQTDSLIKEIISNKIVKEYKEPITLFYGIHNGYAGFRKSYFFNDEIINLKFKLDSKLDYYTIESIYQVIFNRVTANEFPYLNSILPTFKNLNSSNISIKTYKILDKEIFFALKKSDYQSLFQNTINKISPKNILLSLVKNWSKKNLIDLTEQQIVTKSNQYNIVINDPLNDCLFDFGKLIAEYYENKIELLEREYEMQLIQLSERLNTENEIMNIENGINKPEVKNINDENYIIQLHRFYLDKITSKKELESIAKLKNVSFWKETDANSLRKQILESILVENKLL